MTGVLVRISSNAQNQNRRGPGAGGAPARRRREAAGGSGGETSTEKSSIDLDSPGLRPDRKRAARKRGAGKTVEEL